jgi:conjugative relaxase-like TrwC/TraI family protein
VLRIAKLGAGGACYYLRSVGAEPPGSWLGKGSGQAGLTGEVGGSDLEALLEGRDPRSGEVLGSSRDRDRVKVAGFDLMFAAPKSVSILQGIADPQVSNVVASSHAVAVSAAVRYVEDRALGVRRRAGSERRVEPVEGVFAASFVHRTSRALDPHLHTHIVVANLASDPRGRYSALDGRGIYAHAGAAGALYQVQLRRELTERLGVEWGPLDRGRGDIAGISVEARRAFSTRSAQIAADLLESGYSGHLAAGYAAQKTRAPKDLAVGPDDLREGWRRRALEVGLGPRGLEGVLERTAWSTRAEGLEVDSDQVVARLARAGRPVARRNVVQAWCMELRTGSSVSEVLDRSDALLGRMTRTASGSGESPRDGPGVTERRLPLGSLELDPVARRIAEIAVERRAVLQRGSERHIDTGRTGGIRRGQETGIGLGL